MGSEAAQAQRPKLAEDTAVLNERYGILPQTRLPACDSGAAEAYGVVDLHSGSANLYALVCPPQLPPRHEAMSAFAQLADAPLIAPEDWGVIDWLPNQGRRSVVVLQKPTGERLQTPGSGALPRLSESEIKHTVLVPLLPALDAMNANALTHCAIRADNLFYAGHERASVILGEAVSGPAGCAQPAVYETVERAMAAPAGRGPGCHGDDLYALGVTLSLLSRGGDPSAGMAPQDVVAAKLASGSYNWLIGRMRLGLPLIELLRGLLCDDPRDRWTLRDVEMWISGRHMSPKQPGLPPSAQRPFEFCGESYWTARLLAHAMACRWSDAAEALEQGRVETWVRRSLADDAKAEAIAGIVESVAASSGRVGGPSPALARDHMLAQVLILLDPQAPLRYKSLAASVDSLAALLALEFADAEMRVCYAEAVVARLPQAWFAAQEEPPLHLSHVRKDYERAGQFLARPGSDTGIIRCLYEFNPDWPCQSPLVQRECVLSLGQLLGVLERMAQAGAPDVAPADLHIVAFCGARLRRNMTREVEALFEPEGAAETCRATLSLLAQAQRESGQRRLPALAAWLVKGLGPAIESFHNRVYRSELAKAVAELAGEGDLQKLANLADDGSVRRQDTAGFAQAQAQFQQTVHEIQWLQAGGMTNRAHVMRGSQQLSTVVSAALSGLALIILTLSLAT